MYISQSPDLVCGYINLSIMDKGRGAGSKRGTRFVAQVTVLEPATEIDATCGPPCSKYWKELRLTSLTFSVVRNWKL